MIAAGGGGLLSWLDAVVLGVVEGGTSLIEKAHACHRALYGGIVTGANGAAEAEANEEA